MTSPIIGELQYLKINFEWDTDSLKNKYKSVQKINHLLQNDIKNMELDVWMEEKGFNFVNETINNTIHDFIGHYEKICNHDKKKKDLILYCGCCNVSIAYKKMYIDTCVYDCSRCDFFVCGSCNKTKNLCPECPNGTLRKIKLYKNIESVEKAENRAIKKLTAEYETNVKKCFTNLKNTIKT